MIVCSCTGTTDADIARLASEGASSVSDIVQQTGAGRCCVPCQDEIGVLLERFRQISAPLRG